MAKFEVYQLKDTRDELIQQIARNEIATDIKFGNKDLAARIFGGEKGYFVEYNLVAEVEADNLEDVFEKTNTINQVWWQNAGVTRKFPGMGCRSTSVGDIVVDEAGVKHFCASMGWEVLA